MSKPIAEELTLTEALAIAREHMVEPKSSYAKKKQTRTVDSDGNFKSTVSLTEAVTKLLLAGRLSFNKENKVDGINFNDESLLLHSVDYQDVTIISDWSEDIFNKDVSDVTGVIPTLMFHKDMESNKEGNNSLTLKGRLPSVMVGRYRMIGEAPRSRAEMRRLASLNASLTRGRVRDIVQPEPMDIVHGSALITGVLPCWQTRETYGDAEPYESGNDYCVRCSLAVIANLGEYCEDACELTIRRQMASAWREHSIPVSRDVEGAKTVYQKLVDYVYELEAEVEADFVLATSKGLFVADARGGYTSLGVSKTNKSFQQHVRAHVGDATMDTIEKAFSDLDTYIGKGWKKREILTNLS